jgi:anti-anti-sigma regulatory factor
MEIGFAKKGDLRILSIKGNLRLQHWRVIDKHLHVLLDQGARWVVVDLREAVLLGDTGYGCLALNMRKFGERQAQMLLLTASPGVQEALKATGRETGLAENLCSDWDSLEERLRTRGFAFSG